jgi:hypothetical protein
MTNQKIVGPKEVRFRRASLYKQETDAGSGEPLVIS